ncbi:unnamed protein product [Ixodes pacificus]
MVVAVSILIFISVCYSRASASASDCGVRGSSTQGPSTQIVGGEDAAPLEFPWQVFVQRRAGHIHICGGSVINKEYIITAGHCTNTSSPPSSYSVTVEKYHSGQQDPNERKLAVSEVTTHPKFVRATLEYDYALLKLETPLDFSGADKNVMPICLPEMDQTFEDQTCTATGWGTTVNNGETPASILQKVDLPIISFEECSQLIASVDNEDAMICAGYKEVGKSTCSGDSGGPLQCPREDGRYVLAGVTSFGTTCGAPDHPSVFSKVATQVDWIQSVTGETP